MANFNGLPANCPPQNATAPSSLTVYRQTFGPPVSAVHLQTYAELGMAVSPSKECQSHGVSVYTDHRDVANKVQLYPWKGTHVAQGTLDAKDGVVVATPNRKAPDSHHTWWPCNGIDRAALFK